MVDFVASSDIENTYVPNHDDGDDDDENDDNGDNDDDDGDDNDVYYMMVIWMFII
jgi:hypothetical protein